MTTVSYSPEFYKTIAAGTRRSAEVIVPTVMGLIRPKSVVDVGCGLGGWLLVFRKHGVGNILGLDGSYVDQGMLEISDAEFHVVDLGERIELEQMYDLAISLEVAEHLPEEAAGQFVETLTRLSPVVLFSAAIPFQGGEHHVNEQWPEYWGEHFYKHGYVPVDCLRSKFWNNSNVCWWYSQNMLFFVREEELPSYPALREEFKKGTRMPLNVVHPRKYFHCIEDAVRVELQGLIPTGTRWLMVDNYDLGINNWGDYSVLHWDSPANSKIAIEELQQAIDGGAKFLVFAWSAFWWLKHYEELRQFIVHRFLCLLSNERVIVYSLENPTITERG